MNERDNMNVNDRAIHQLLSDVGEIKGQMVSMHEILTNHEERISKNDKRLDKVDVFFGKVGIVVIGVGFVAAFLFDLIREWVTSIFRQ